MIIFDSKQHLRRCQRERNVYVFMMVGLQPNNEKRFHMHLSVDVYALFTWSAFSLIHSLVSSFSILFHDDQNAFALNNFQIWHLLARPALFFICLLVPTCYIILHLYFSSIYHFRPMLYEFKDFLKLRITYHYFVSKYQI